MLTQNVLERERYNARLKLARDERGIIKAAREAGREEGREEGWQQGAIAGRIRLLEELLGLPVTAMDALTQLSLTHLHELARKLSEQLRDRNCESRAAACDSLGIRKTVGAGFHQLRPFSLHTQLRTLNSPHSVIVVVVEEHVLLVAFREHVGDQIQDLFFGQLVEQADRHDRCL